MNGFPLPLWERARVRGPPIVLERRQVGKYRGVLGSLDNARAVFFHGVSKEEDMTGTIKKIMKDRGFGFIAPDEGEEEVFFHRSRLAPKVYFEDLREGDEVEFQVRPGEKGPQAFNLKLRRSEE